MKRKKINAAFLRLIWLFLAVPANLLAAAMFFPEILVRFLLAVLAWPFLFIATGQYDLMAFIPKISFYIFTAVDDLRGRWDI